MLTEKYRPTDLKDLILASNIRQMIANYINKKEAPNLLFYSVSPGTGKTALSFILSDELESERLVINASKERGIDIVRELIEPFITTASFNGKKKAVLLSECEALTSSAAKSLKDMFERIYSVNVYYILTTNEKTKILPALRSRCLELDFSFPPKQDIIKRLNYIIVKEKINITEPDLEMLVETFYPDIRKMINGLEKVVNGVELNEILGEEIKFSDIVKAIKNGVTTAKIYELIKEIPVVSFCYYYFKVLLYNGEDKKIQYLNKIIQNIYWGVDEKIAFISYLPFIR